PPSGRETPHDEMPEPPQVRERVYALAVTSSLLFAPPLSGAFSFGIRGEKSGRSPFRSVQVGLARTSAEAALGARGASFAWWTGQLAICPFGLGLTGGGEAQACAALQLGVLRGAGKESPALSPALS